MKYSDNNVQYLLQNLDRLHADHPWNSLGKLRASLTEGRHEEYPKIAAELGICLCKMCHAPTTYEGTKLCNYCYNISGLEQVSRWTSTKMGVASLREIKDRIETLLKDIE